MNATLHGLGRDRRHLVLLSIICTLTFASSLSITAAGQDKAQTSQRKGVAGPIKDGVQYCWINAKTGKPVPVIPTGILSGFDQADAVEQGHAHNPRTGQNFNQDGSGDWIDSATGNLVSTVPVGILSGFDQADAVEQGHAHNPRTGDNYVRVPCPPPTPSTTNPPAPPPPSHAAPPSAQPATPSAPVAYQPPVYGAICWYLLGESLPISTKDMYPSGSVPDPNDPNHATNLSTGTDFVRRTDGTWTNSGTGNSIPDDQLTPFGHPESPGDPGKAYEPSFPDRAGRAWRRGPCPPPANSVLPYTLAPGFTTYISVTFGVFGRTDTYDDDYKIGGIAVAPGVRAGMIFPFLTKGFTGIDFGMSFPVSSAKLDTTVTKLDSLSIFEVMAGMRADIQKHPVRVSGSFGGAVGVVRSGYDSSGYKYSDTEAMPGITVSGGASTPLTKRLSGFLEVRYTDLFSATFDSPGGHYNMKDSSISGTVGVEFNFHKVQTK